MKIDGKPRERFKWRSMLFYFGKKYDRKVDRGYNEKVKDCNQQFGGR